MTGGNNDLKALRATKRTSSYRRTGTLERVRSRGYNAVLNVLDALDAVRGRRDPLLPPRRNRRFIGNGDFAKVGGEIVTFMQEEMGLGRSNSVLDVGCGAGRIAVPLTSVLDDGCYLGFDIVQHAIDWSRETITARYPNFRFEHVDVRQEIYNPDGSLAADDFAFPAADATFDIIAMVGLISHLRPAELDNYLHETARVLRPGGTCLVTAYLVTDRVAANMTRGDTAFRFTHDRGDHLVHSEDEPTYAIAYRLDYLRTVMARHGLAVGGEPRFGTWGSSASRPASMDVMVLERTSAE